MDSERNNGDLAITVAGEASPVEPQPLSIPPPPSYALSVATNNSISKTTYRECSKNHAISMGGFSLDGCREFLGTGPEGSTEAFICSVCGCHRNFHRKVEETVTNTPTSVILAAEPLAIRPPAAQYSAGYWSPSGFLQLTSPVGNPNRRAVALAPAGGVVHMAVDDGGVGGSNLRRRRFRTRFTGEQKEKMLSFAERLGWKIQRADESAVMEFCNETGVNRQVFKVWMHNNKYTLGNQQQHRQQH